MKAKLQKARVENQPETKIYLKRKFLNVARLSQKSKVKIDLTAREY